ncbi:MAG: FAD-binding protein [Ruminococcus sp.]|nr:FAD-binding protein [Ruminococcus sp.]
MITLKNLKLPLRYTGEQLHSEAARALNISTKDIVDITLRRVSIDARKKSDIHYIAMADVQVDGDDSKIIKKCKNAEVAIEKEYRFTAAKIPHKRPVVIGSGPAGLFCALILARNGAKPIVIERGQSVDERTKSIDIFWEHGKLNTQSNVQFGEGGAGTFSDGKLNTGTNDIRQSFVLKEFVAHGAPKDILISAKPHIGTDMLKGTIKSIRKEIESLGGEFRFNTLFCDFKAKNGKINEITIITNESKEIIDTDNVVLATGHSSRDTFEMLRSKGIAMQQKPFSIGARIEHLREEVDECQYGKARHLLPAADYKLSTHLSSGRGVYTFCMCPGGYVVNASSESGRLCTNGMSKFARNNQNSNSAVLVGITPEDYDCGDVLDGMKLQRKIEEAAFNLLGGFSAPVQRVGDFLNKAGSVKTLPVPTIKPGYEFCDISKIYPSFITDSLKEGIVNLSKRAPFFENMGAVLTAPETRSSSPVRIIRDETFQSVSCKGIYPCGEGAGYAGGIMSAATDGIKCAEAILS